MENCSVKRYFTEVNNANLPIIGKLQIKVETLTTRGFSINKTPYSIFHSSSTNGKVTIVGGDATFEGGGKVANIAGGVSVITPEVGDIFTMVVDDIYDLTSLYLPNPDNDIKVLSVIGSIDFIETLTKLILKNFENEYIIRELNSEGLTEIALTSGITIDLDTFFDHSNFSNVTKFDANNMNKFVGSTTIKRIADSLKRNGTSSLVSWGQIINSNALNDSNISGDVADIPDNVNYLNIGMNIKHLKCSLGKRNSSTCSILSCGGGVAYLETHEDVDNYLINNSGCTLDQSDTHKFIKLTTEASYTPSASAQTAIATLYTKGITSIKVNNVEMDSYRNS